MTYNVSISDSDCIKAAQEVEKIDRELGELMAVLADIDNSATPTTTTSTSFASQPSTFSNVDVDPLVAWLDGLVNTTLPAMSNQELPKDFDRLLTKPIEQSWLDERAMSSFDYLIAQEQWGGSNSASPITISSDGSSAAPIKISDGLSTSDRSVGRGSSPVLVPASPLAAISESSFKTPDRPTEPASTQAPKKQTKRHYSRWSMAHLQEEYLQRFKPMSQKRTMDRQFMIDALAHHDMLQATSPKK
jgi:hypothetical protein